jgi:uncharacterized membrane protein YfcA
MALPIVGGASVVGAVQHWRKGNVDFRTAAVFGLAAMLGAFGGAKLAHFVSGGVQLTLLACLMLGAAISMLRNAALPEAPMSDERYLGIGVLAVGLGVGVLTGLLGVGGGFLLVPALVLLAKVPMKKAIGTTLVIIAMNTTAGYLGYLGTVDVPWRLVLAFGGVAAIGIVLGTALVPRIPQAALKRGFAILLVLIALLIFWQQFGSTSPVGSL